MPVRSNSSSYERTVEQYNKMSMSDLKEVAKLKNLSQKGPKSDLVARLSKSEEPVVVLEKLDNIRGRTNRASQNGNANGLHSSLSKSSKQEQQQRQLRLLSERESLVLWLHPFRTIGFFIFELGFQCRQLLYRLAENSVSVACVVALAGLAVLSAYVPGPHLLVLASSSKYFWWCAYWVGLGILSSVGLGTGLHTFLLYLGPHIAAVTLAAFECKTVDFPEPPYPDEIVCPDGVGAGVTLWTIISKVRLEAFMWGAGTALGELPPYFMARAARLSGQLDEEEEELMDLIDASKKGKQQGVLDRAKLAVHGLVKRVGFVGILLCASIPNPLFDLAGITCGHFLVPFWTFFGATLIGKALIKMHIQMLFVIFTFSASHVDHVVQLIGHIPHYGPQLQAPFREYLEKQKTKLHHKPGTGEAGSDASILAWIFEKVVALFLLYFVVSIVNSMAQNYHKRISRVQQQQIQAASRR